MELHIRDVSKTYSNGVQALKDVTLTIPVGMYGLLGPNGAGKSTLMRILATLQEPDEGSVRLGDTDVLNQKDDVRKQKLGGYSGGMLQRFGVAVAFLGNPKLMIVDEPTAGLDPAERVRFLNLLSELGENSVVLLSTHIVEDVSEVCTKMAIIDNGEILLEAEPLGAVDKLRGRIWRRVISKQELPELEREHAVISTTLLAGRTVVRVYSDTAPGPGFEPAEPDVKDIYFSAMAGHIGRRRQPPEPVAMS